MNEIKQTIDRVIYTLNRIDVRGRDNLNSLLGCIQALDGASAKLAELQVQASQESKEEPK